MACRLYNEAELLRKTYGDTGNYFARTVARLYERAGGKRVYGSPSAFVESLLQAAQHDAAEREAAQAKLEQRLLDVINDDTFIRVTPDYWDKKKAMLRARFGDVA